LIEDGVEHTPPRRRALAADRQRRHVMVDRHLDAGGIRQGGLGGSVRITAACASTRAAIMFR
jgi:hypothetical protein